MCHHRFAPNAGAPRHYASMDQKVGDLKLQIAELNFKRNGLERDLKRKIELMEKVYDSGYEFNSPMSGYTKGEHIKFINDAKTGIQNGVIVGHIKHSGEWLVDVPIGGSTVVGSEIVHSRYFVSVKPIENDNSDDDDDS